MFEVSVIKILTSKRIFRNGIFLLDLIKRNPKNCNRTFQFQIKKFADALKTNNVS
jgi:hypothetical protein